MSSIVTILFYQDYVFGYASAGIAGVPHIFDEPQLADG